MATRSPKTIESRLIRYLKKEGLYELIPEDRRLTAFDFSQKNREVIKSNLGFILYYLAIYWSLDTALVGGISNSWMFALLGPSVPLLIVTLLGVAIALIVPRIIKLTSAGNAQQTRSSSPTKASPSGRLFEDPILLSFPVMLTILDWYWTSWRVAASYALVFAPMYLLYPRVYDDDTRSDLLYLLRRPRAYFVLGWITFRHMLDLLVKLAPVLLIIVLFSVEIAADALTLSLS